MGTRPIHRGRQRRPRRSLQNLHNDNKRTTKITVNQISISFLLLLLVAFLLFNLLACFSSIHILTFDMPEKDSRHGWPICEAREISSLCPKCNALNFPRASIGLETS